MLTGRADAEPSAAQAKGASNSEPIKEIARPEVEAPQKPAPKKSLARKLLPVKHSGGY